MIGEIISILAGDAYVTQLVNASNIYAIQRKQGSPIPSVTVDLLDVRTNETKTRSSDLDFVTMQVIAYHDNPRQSYLIAQACRDALDNYFGTFGNPRERIEIRFDDLETGIIPDDETFATVANYMVTVTREAQDRHS